MNISFRTSKGVSFSGDSLELINNKSFIRKHKNKINLIFTSPPFSLLKKKKFAPIESLGP